MTDERDWDVWFDDLTLLSVPSVFKGRYVIDGRLYDLDTTGGSLVITASDPHVLTIEYPDGRCVRQEPIGTVEVAPATT